MDHGDNSRIDKRAWCFLDKVNLLRPTSQAVESCAAVSIPPRLTNRLATALLVCALLPADSTKLHRLCRSCLPTEDHIMVASERTQIMAADLVFG